jgi:predicted O-linked N-acetylglucosamine transferase (SPINDLY family)
MQSVFGLHDRSRFNIFVYATSPSDGSSYRQKIESQTEHFLDVHLWETSAVVDRIVQDQIHICRSITSALNRSTHTKNTISDQSGGVHQRREE